MSEENNGTLLEEDCKAVLSNSLTEGNNWKYISCDINPIPSGAGFIGTHYKVTIHFNQDSEHLSKRYFLKVLNNSSKVVFEMSLSLNAYEKEELMYVTFVKEFGSAGLDISYAPKSNLCRPYLIVLEDLSLRGYTNTPKKDMLDIEHCKVGLRALAHFHASAIAYEELKSKEQHTKFRLLDAHSRYLGDKIFSETENAASIWLKCTLLGLLQIIDLLPTNEISAEEFKAKLIEEVELCGELAKPSDSHRNTLLHGDLWSNNFMFRYEGGKPVDSILIDYQLLKYGVPALDVVQMVVTNVRRNLRLKYYDELLESYHQSFSGYLEKSGLNADDILPRSEFLKSCEEVSFTAKLQAAADHSVTFLVDETVADAFACDEKLERFLFQDRSESIIASYNTSDLFRQILQEDLMDLRDLLFCK